MSSAQRTLMVMAGGTGGHVYPAMAVADTLHDEGWHIVWLVTEGGMENRLIAGKPYATATIPMRGVRGKGLGGWLVLPLRLCTALRAARVAIRMHQPHVILGMGGFAAFPGGVVGRCMGIPLVIHEQNSVAGLTNKVLARMAQRVLTAFPAALGKRSELVGNPVRANLNTLPDPALRFQHRSGPLRILVVGGSLGAAALNTLLPQAFGRIAPSLRPEIIHQAGEKHLSDLQQQYALADVHADCRAFIHDMATVYAWADLVICRAGALTIAELANIGVGSILVPFPYAVDDHQTGNARYLSDAGAAIVIQQRALDVAQLAKLIEGLSRNSCLFMAQAAHALAQPHATQQVASICKQMANERHP